MKSKMIFTKLKDEEEHSVLEQEIIRLMDKALKERLVNLSIDDIKIIAKELMPDLDRIIAKKVKKHFYEIGQFLTNKFKDGG